jgi:hypothetical protein
MRFVRKAARALPASIYSVFQGLGEECGVNQCSTSELRFIEFAADGAGIVIDAIHGKRQNGRGWNSLSDAGLAREV